MRKLHSPTAIGAELGDGPHALSGGMRQRISIARSQSSNIVLCDKPPLSALDRSAAGRLRARYPRG
jgi:NitT/TauT family transport system ATP-binding protein